MLKVEVDIRVGRLRLKRVTDVSVSRNWRNLTQTATISFPRRAYLNGQEVKVKDYIKPGDSVTIKAGYNGLLETEFTGYLVRYNPNRPFVLECEDEMWKLKKGDITRVFAAGTPLRTLISAIYSGPAVYLDGTEQLGEFTLKNATPAMVLEQLKRDYNIYSFFQNGVLVVGYQYNPNTQRTWVFNPDVNMVDKAALVYRTKDESQFHIKGISIKPDNSRISYTAGEAGGEHYDRIWYNITYADLKRNVDRELANAVYDGWRGSFTAWGAPYVQPGDIVNLTNNYYPEYNGRYLVDGTTLRISRSGGMRRTIYPGPAAGSVIN